MTEEGARDVVRRVLRRIAPEADFDSVPPAADWRRELDLDSMDFLEFVTGLSKAAGVEVPERDYLKISTPETCIRYVMEHASAAVVRD